MLSILFAIAIIAITYLLAIKPFRYWKDRNVKTSTTIPIFGENFWAIIGRESFLELLIRLSNLCPGERYFGFYQFTKPMLYLRSPELIKQICVKDFDHFLNRQTFLPEKSDDLLSRNLTALKGQKWKDMRSTLSPSFTSSKMKSIFVLICKNAEQFVNYFSNQEGDIVEVEFKDAMTRFTNDVIASTAYGLQVDSLKEKDNTFYKMGRKATNFVGFRFTLAILISQWSPKLAALLNIPLIDKKVQSFFYNIVKDTIEYRKTQNIKRPDVIGMLIDAQKEDDKENDSCEAKEGFSVVEEHLEIKTEKKDLSVMDIAAQTFLFFFAGFEVVSNLLCFALYELAVNPDIQKKLRDEIYKNSSDGEISYGTLMNLEYLDMVLSETLRKWPLALVTDRVVTKQYTIQPEQPNEKPVILEPGATVFISVLGLHLNPKYFENPEKFDPERFSPENRHKIDPYTYIPFGAGPRNCIGNRFALMEVKTLLFKILFNFEIVPTKRTQIPLKMNRKAFGYIPTDGFHLGLKKRNV